MNSSYNDWLAIKTRLALSDPVLLNTPKDGTVLASLARENPPNRYHKVVSSLSRSKSCKLRRTSILSVVRSNLENTDMILSFLTGILGSPPWTAWRCARRRFRLDVSRGRRRSDQQIVSVALGKLRTEEEGNRMV